MAFHLRDQQSCIVMYQPIETGINSGSEPAGLNATSPLASTDTYFQCESQHFSCIIQFTVDSAKTLNYMYS